MAYDKFLLPLLQRAIADLSENLHTHPDAEQRQRLIAFFRKTLEEARAAEPGAGYALAASPLEPGPGGSDAET